MSRDQGLGIGGLESSDSLGEGAQFTAAGSVAGQSAGGPGEVAVDAAGGAISREMVERFWDSWSFVFF